MIDIKDLEAFASILDGGSISKAAHDMGLTQPALSLKLKKMEQELGVQLFQRTSRNVIPLETARMIEAKVRDVLASFDGVKEALASRMDEVAGLVRIGCIMGWFKTLLVESLPELHKTCPKIRLKFTSPSTNEIIHALSHGGLDMAIVAEPFERHGDSLTFEHLLDEELVLIGDKLEKPKDDLKKWREILLSRQFLLMDYPDKLLEVFWKSEFNESCPWDKINCYVRMENIRQIQHAASLVPNSAVIIPRQIVPKDVKIASSMKMGNKLYLAYRTGAFELKRYKLVRDVILNRVAQYEKLKS